MKEELIKRVCNIKNERKKKVITSILSNDNWYKELSIETILSILLDLGYDSKDAKRIYIELLKNN